MFKQFLKYILLLPAILSVLLTSTQASAACNATTNGNWSTVGIWSCGYVPITTDDVNITASPVTLNQDVAVKSITIAFGGSLNASNFILTLTATEPIIVAGSTFTPGTSTVKLSDANHTINTSITFYNLQWVSAPTAARTITINTIITIAASGTFNLDGMPTNPVTFAGTGNFGSPVTVNNCAGKPASMTNLTCNPPAGGGGGAVSAPIGISLDTKPVIFSREVVR